MGWVPADPPRLTRPMTTAEAKAAVAKLFYYLDIVEESDSGNEFHPNFISSCRTMDGVAMNNLLKQLKQWSQENTHEEHEETRRR